MGARALPSRTPPPTQGRGPHHLILGLHGAEAQEMFTEQTNIYFPPTAICSHEARAGFKAVLCTRRAPGFPLGPKTTLAKGAPSL